MKLYNAITAAKRLGVNRETVRKMAASGDIKAVKMWGQWVIYEDELNRLRKQQFPTTLGGNHE